MSEKNFQAFERVIQELNELDDSDLRAEYLLEAAGRFHPQTSSTPPPYPESYRVPGCESGVYLFPKHSEDETLSFTFVVENPHGISAKALAVILSETLSGAKYEQIRKLRPEMVKDIFGSHLTLAKDQGLRNLICKVKESTYSRTTENSAD